MMSQNSDSVDPWTAMPLEFEDRDIEPVALAAVPAAKKSQPSKFDVQGMFWKYVASGSAGTPSEVLSCLATDSAVNIRRRVAANHSTSPDALAILAKDADKSVRAAVARNKVTPIFILRQLAQDDEVEVRFAIASNAEMPDAILLSLFLDPDPMVAERASQTMAA
jgi:hypothetical protein